MESSALPHASERLPHWRDAWRKTGKLVLLLDFDGTLAPIVPRPEDAALPDATAAALRDLRAIPSLEMAVVSGRAVADARDRVGIPDIAYAGNHGMEIEAPGLVRIHEEAAASRPRLESAAAELAHQIRGIPGVLVEDKELTLSVHYRRVAPERVEEVRRAVFAVAGGHEGLRVTEGKMILEVRPRVDWHKGKAVEFLLGELRPPAGAPVIYLGDDQTDEDAFRVLRAQRSVDGEGVIVADPQPIHTAASAYLRGPDEVADLLRKLVEVAPEGRLGRD